MSLLESPPTVCISAGQTTLCPKHSNIHLLTSGASLLLNFSAAPQIPSSRIQPQASPSTTFTGLRPSSSLAIPRYWETPPSTPRTSVSLLEPPHTVCISAGLLPIHDNSRMPGIECVVAVKLAPWGTRRAGGHLDSTLDDQNIPAENWASSR